jgi:hypothetical protein
MFAVEADTVCPPRTGSSLDNINHTINTVNFRHSNITIGLRANRLPDGTFATTARSSRLGEIAENG